MTQRTLFGDEAGTGAYGEPRQAPPRARAIDPAPSHAAAREIEESGLAAVQSARVLTLIRKQPGSTVRELDAYASEMHPDWGMTVHIIGRRVSELVKTHGTARYGEPRRCRLGLRIAQPVYPADA